ncbi:MAG: ATP-dependent DNA helicase RecG, partial [Gammaproteobacteria bacterium]
MSGIGAEDSGLTTTPENSVTKLRGVGPRVAQRLARLGIQTTEDLLFHLPARYQDRTRTVAIGSLRPGQEAVIAGEVELAQVQYRGRRALVAAISDGTGLAYLRFFHFSNLQQRTFKRGARIRCFGVARSGPRGVELIHPEYQVLADDAPEENEEQLTPIYPATEGLGQLTLRKLTSQALNWLEQGGGLEELLPGSVLAESEFPDLHEALRFVHRPPTDTPMALLEDGRSPAHQRLAFEELLAHHLSLRRLRRQLSEYGASRLRGSVLPDRFLESLPFPLTIAQQRVVGEVRNDLEQPRPMHRLVQGDVGSGKTVV